MNAHLLPFGSCEPAMDITSLTTALPAVSIEGLTKSFELRPVVRDVSVVVPAATCLALLGPNGAGKTTLLRVLATLIKPTRGRVLIDGLDVRAEASTIRRIVGYVGHQPLLYDELTARENLLFFAKMYRVTQAERRVDALLARVGLKARANERVRVFSRGQLQRLALARGIVHQPRLLLLDEPDTGLDDDAITLLGELVAERRVAGVATIITTHNLERGLALSDAALVLVGGRVAALEAASALSADAVRTLYRQAHAAPRRMTATAVGASS